MNFLEYDELYYEAFSTACYFQLDYYVKYFAKLALTTIPISSRDAHKYMLELLLKNEISTEQKCINLQKALHFAIMARETVVVKYLVESGVDIEAKDKNGKTALHFAAETGKAELIEYLVEKGADVSAKTNYN